jgi:hypothetical protein
VSAGLLAAISSASESLAGETTSSATNSKPVSWWGFHTPSGNIYCNSGPPGTKTLDCVMLSASHGPYQRAWRLRSKGRPLVRDINGNIGTEVAVLGYGRTWQRKPLMCFSQSRALTCQNSQGHGFRLSRQSQRMF